MVTTTQIKESIEKAAACSGLLSIEKYRSSNGSVKDHVVHIRPGWTYKGLVKESLDNLDKLEMPEGALKETWSKAKEEQRASWEKTLNGEQKPNKTFSLQKSGSFFVSPGDHEHVYLMDCEILESTTHIPDPQVKSSEVVMLKKYICKMSPISKYQPMLKLGPDKISDIHPV